MTMAGTIVSNPINAMQCVPVSDRNAIMNQKYNGGLSAYAAPWL